jgi:hypothetical protein
MASGGLLSGREVAFPDGLRAGDFVQMNSHFQDIFFEVAGVLPPCLDDLRPYWSIEYVSYDKYGSQPRRVWTNSGGPGVRAVVKAEMAVPVLTRKHMRFHSEQGQFDPFYGFAPRGTPLRVREAA